jgi:hypothetical protein
VEIVAAHTQGVGVKGAVAALLHFVEMIIKGDDGAVPAFTDQRYLRVPVINLDLFLVSADFQVDGNALVGKRLADVDGGLDAAEVTLATRRHGEFNFMVLGEGCACQVQYKCQ